LVVVSQSRSAGGGGSGWNDPGFYNVLTNATREGSNIVSDTQYIPIPNSTSDLTYDDNDQSVGGITVPNGAVRWNDTNGAAFSTNEYVVIRIVTPENWTGNIDAMALKLGVTSAGTSTIIGAKDGADL